MDAIYWICLLVGGFFVLLSIFGGGEADAEAEAEFDFDAEADTDYEVDYDGAVEVGSGAGLVDLLSVRALFLFAAFFGLTGVLLGWIGTGEPLTALVAVLMGLVVGLGGNFVIRRVGYAHVSSDISALDLRGRTGQVLIPFEGAARGKISLVAKGHRLQLVARGLEGSPERFRPGDEVVVLRMEGGVAEVVKPE